MKCISLLAQIAIASATLWSVHQSALAEQTSATHTIVIEEMKFVPDSLKVKAGDTIIWVNKDIFPHTATGEKKSFDSGEIPATKSWRYVAKKKGILPYICTYHPTMKGKLKVE